MAAMNDIQLKDESFVSLDKAASLAKNSKKMSPQEKINIQIMVNNTKKDICYKREEYDESISYLQA